MNSLEHLRERHAGMLEDGADLDCELGAAVAALLGAVTNNAVGFFTLGLAANARQIMDATASDTAMWANHSCGGGKIDGFASSQAATRVV